jgi:hypothetical protein
VSRNGPRGCAKSVAPTAEIVGLRLGETDPPRRYRVSRVAEGSSELKTGHGEVVRRRASEIPVFKSIDRTATAGGEPEALGSERRSLCRTFPAENVELTKNLFGGRKRS